ncbi:FUSC family protein (plasmid) [Agrobacterium tumefaciens]|uniref:FUSC family protein n=1 Tax=Agrobacterium TaxID=357 RepID=UPI000FDDF18E|nr:FUSC family protein [Agrobacterium sp. RS6]QTQ85863.1 FUSC family protein [Agrobacterium tumefaciens]
MDDLKEKHGIKSILNYSIFVLRCSGAAMVSYLAAVSLNLEHPVWAAMSSLIVLQEDERATQKAAVARVIGTCAGIAIAVLVGALTRPMGASTTEDIGISVAFCAIFTRKFPDMRVAMWTAPLVYLSRSPGIDLWDSGVGRVLEVLLGAAVGAAFHWGSVRALRALD